ncbi:MAG: dihydrodipicolinate synthase family protein [Pseudomonadota bacterium]
MFTGLSAFVATPANEEGRVDTGHLQRLVANVARPGITSIGVLGSTGNYMYLSQAERGRALEAAVEAAGETPVLAGIGAMATRDVIENAQVAERFGAAGLLLAPVSYLPLTDEDVFGLFSDVAAATSTPICVYNNPGTTGVTISKDLLARLARISGVDAVKNPAPSLLDAESDVQAVRRDVPDGFVVGYSGDARIAGVLPSGADAWYSVLAGTMPEPCIALWEARSDPAALAALDDRMRPMWECFNHYGSIRVVFELIEMVGLGRVMPPRPLLPLNTTAYAHIKAALEHAQTV